MMTIMITMITIMITRITIMITMITFMITRIKMTTGAGDRAQTGNMALSLTDGGQEDCAG